MRIPLLLLVFLSAGTARSQDPTIHVLVWDERQPQQAEAYDDFLGNEIAARLRASSSGLEIRSVALDDLDQGLSVGNLEWCDVLIWWGHVRHSDVTNESARRVVEYVRRGELDLIALHSAHWARPFVHAMNWRSIEDGRKKLLSVAEGMELSIETVDPPRERTVPAPGSVLTPACFAYRTGPNSVHGLIHLPWCCFPDYRPDGQPSTIVVRSPQHPIASGLPATFQVKQTEMYNEPFHVPDPDEVIFEETWEAGESFRSGMVWSIGDGKVFYFRPGHETYPVFKQPELIKVLENACRWLGSDN